jgi:hypothetical protein
MVGNYDFANGTAIVQHWSRVHSEDRGQRPRLQRAFAPGTQHESADCEGHEWTAHVDQNQRPRICLESREQGDAGVFDEEKAEPANQGDLQSTDRIDRIEP